MDTIFTRLDEASRVGDVDSLKRLLEEDKFLLERMSTGTSITDNPLHIAALFGHSNFIAEIISRRPDLAKQLNGQGLSPLHLAAGSGHLLVVKELLKVGSDLCLVREGTEGFMPLHVAVVKGRTLIVKELIEACEVSMHEVTYGGEALLHLAVKSTSMETLEFLISRVHDLNAKDAKGNTALHLAVAKRQSYVIKLLLSKSSMDMNSMNSRSFTPLDILLESHHEYGDLVIGEMIIKAGGTTAPQPAGKDPDPTPELMTSNKPLFDRLTANRDIEKTNEELRKEEENKWFSSDILMVEAILVATITFTAAINPPGGFDDDGHAVLGEDLFFFLIFDMIGLFSSVSVILLLLCVVPRKRKTAIKFLVWILWLATFSMALAFTSAISEIFVDNYIPEHILVMGWFLVLMIGVLWVAIRVIIILLKKGDMLKPIKEWLFSLWIRRPFRWQCLNGSSCQLKNLTCHRHTLFVVLIIGVLFGVSVIYFVIVQAIITAWD